MCQKARIIVHDPDRGTTVAPSESSAGRTSRSKREPVGGNVDIMQVQRILERNPDLSDVVSDQMSLGPALAHVDLRADG